MAGQVPEIRPYEPCDREAVRQIAYDTGLMGSTIAGQWSDKDSFADMVTGYYTDNEPESAFVAVVGQKVVGYLLGCKDTSKRPDPTIVAVRQVLKKALFLKPGTAGMVWRSVGDGIKLAASGSVKPSELRFSDARWPAHFHINLEPEVRRMGVGSKLVNKWLSELSLTGVKGCHLDTLTEGNSSPAMTFFEAQGFEKYGRKNLLPGMRSAQGNHVYYQLMVRDL